MLICWFHKNRTAFLLLPDPYAILLFAAGDANEDQNDEDEGEVTDLEELLENVQVQSDEDSSGSARVILHEDVEVFSGGNGSHNLSASDVSAGSEVDLASIEPGVQANPELQGVQPLPDKSEQAQREVPVGKFWQHDDRTDEDANNRYQHDHPMRRPQS